jgi:CheY-like chemotaxis protein
MDVQMPEMDGLEATRMIREAEGLKDRRTPIVALTAHAIKGDREMCLETGMDAYISKPVRARELYGTIARLVAERAIQPVVPAGVASSPGGRAESAGVSDGAVDELALEGALDWSAAAAEFPTGEKMLRDLAPLFLDECPKLLRQICEAIMAGDATTLRRAAHTLKGSAAVFRAGPTVEVAQKLELQADRGELDAARATTSALATESSRLLAALRAKLKLEPSAAGGGAKQPWHHLRQEG